MKLKKKKNKNITRKILTKLIFDFWINWGIPEYQGTDEELKNEIYENLGSLNGIDEELSIIQTEFDNEWSEYEYQELKKIQNFISFYKIIFEEENKKNEKN